MRHMLGLNGKCAGQCAGPEQLIQLLSGASPSLEPAHQQSQKLISNRLLRDWLAAVLCLKPGRPAVGT
jgi:hypothetical protein